MLIVTDCCLSCTDFVLFPEVFHGFCCFCWRLAWHVVYYKGWKNKRMEKTIHFHLHQYQRMENNKLKIHFTFMNVNYLHETKQNIVELNRNTIIERIFGH